MQPQDSANRTAGAVKHPDATEWMAFLYGEIAPERKRELDKHLAECTACTEQVSAWRSGMTALDDWKIPVTRATTPWALPVLKWAAAAAVMSNRFSEPKLHPS